MRSGLTAREEFLHARVVFFPEEEERKFHLVPISTTQQCFEPILFVPRHTNGHSNAILRIIIRRKNVMEMNPDPRAQRGQNTEEFILDIALDFQYVARVNEQDVARLQGGK